MKNPKNPFSMVPDHESMLLRYEQQKIISLKAKKGVKLGVSDKTTYSTSNRCGVIRGINNIQPAKEKKKRKKATTTIEEDAM